MIVVVPARDEQERIAACLLALRRALDAVVDALPAQCVVLVADGCTDLTATMSRLAWGADPRLHVVATPAAGPGAARRLGVLVGEEMLGRRARSAWIATTDADTRVPRDWIARQLRWVARGYDGVAGTVHVDDWKPSDGAVKARYELMLRDARLPGGVHRDVFGANLGVRAAALRSVGGFPELRIGEDHAVWDRLAVDGVPLVAPLDVTVATSGRRRGRARGGLADLLETLATPVIA